jgi:hypothetical protein
MGDMDMGITLRTIDHHIDQVSQTDLTDLTDRIGQTNRTDQIGQIDLTDQNPNVLLQDRTDRQQSPQDLQWDALQE